MNNKGIALILVISILTVVAITVVSFIFAMRLENRAAANYLWQGKAGYIAEAGLAHARALLKQDKTNGSIDTHQDPWRSALSGNDIDNNGDGTTDSGWIEIALGDELIGRYAVLVEDESAKININTAGFHNESALKATQGASPFEVSLKDFFSAKNVSSAGGLSQAVIDWRYGEDKAAGAKGVDDNKNQTFFSNDNIDNDADGNIDQAQEGTDEPQEFVPSYPYADDRPFLASEEIKRVPEVSAGAYNRIKAEITAYSNTASIDRNRDLQQDINSIDAQQLLDVFLQSGIVEPWQKVANIVDFADRDFAQSVVTKSTLPFYTQNQGPKGDWRWVGDHYESKTYGGIKGLWSWTGIEAGGYYLILHGRASGEYIGDVTIGELTQAHTRSGETFKMFPSGTITVADAGGGRGSLTITIQNNEALGTTCYFKHIELCSAEGKTQGSTVEIRGIEGIRINEIMVQPTIEMATASYQQPGGDWLWQDDCYKNTVGGGGPTGQGSWVWEDIPDGEYYLTLFGASSGQIIGDVRADGTIQENMRSGERFTGHETVSVSGGVFRLDIQNNLASGTCYFQSALLSQQPDAEYIELVNLTPDQVDLGGFSLEASGTDGWPASIPLGTSIGPGEYLILAVDKEDTCAGISANAISFENIWGGLLAAQLDFTRSLTSYSDMFDDAASPGEIILRDGQGNIVDIQYYSSSEISPYVSLERGDPTTSGSNWFKSLDLSRATPAKKNNNPEIIEQIGEEIVEHSLDEVVVKNCPFANLGEVAQVSTGGSWEKVDTEDLMNLADKLTVYSLRLEAEGHKDAGDWSEKLRPSPQTAWFESSNPGEVGTWLWDEQMRIPNGVYALYLYGDNGRAFSVSLHLADDSWTPFTPPLTPGANNSVCFGRIELGGQNEGSLPAGKIELRLKNASASSIAYFDYIHLAPLPYVPGKLNINTASSAVLEALPKIDTDTAQRIIAGRPYGNKEDKGRGIGDILSESILDSDRGEKIAKFSALSNLISVRSDIFQIIATGQALRGGRVMAEKKIRMVIER